MAWRFQPGEELDAAFRRVAAEEVGYVRGMLAASDCDREQAVHQTRRSFKRLRALLRLAKPSLGSAYSKENRRWRDAGRLLSATRDAHVLMQTLDAVLARCADGLTAQEGDDMRRRLRAKAGPSDRSADAVERDIETVVGMVEAAEKEAGKLAWPRDVDELRRGLKRSQSRLRQSWKAARKHPEAAENLHEWRKCVKDYAAQMGLFREILPHELKACRKDARDLAENSWRRARSRRADRATRQAPASGGGKAGARNPARPDPAATRRACAPPPSRRAKLSPPAAPRPSPTKLPRSGTKRRKGLTQSPRLCNCSRNRFVLAAPMAGGANPADAYAAARIRARVGTR